MTHDEMRTPLIQPEGHVGEQVDMMNANGAIDSTYILSRDPVSTAFLSVHFPCENEVPEKITEADIFYLTPGLKVGWETNLSSSGVLTAIKELLPERPVKEICCVPPTDDSRYFADADNPYYTTSVDEALKEERTEIEVYLGNPSEVITWRNAPGDPLYRRHIAFSTNDPFAMKEGIIRNLIDHTAMPDKRPAILAALAPLKAFYAQYVEIAQK